MSRHSLKHRAEYFLLRSVCGWIRSKPISSGLSVHLGLARIWFELVKIRREQTIENLRIAFPNLSDAELLALARSAFRHISRVMVENVLLDKIVRSEINSFVGNGNWQVLEGALKEKKGVVLITGHQGNWELSGSVIALRGYPFYALAAAIRNKLVDKYVSSHRSALRIPTIRPGESKQVVPKKLREGAIVAFIADQDAGRKGIFVPFFGRNASTHTGPAVFAVRYRVPVVYGTSYRTDGKYHFHFERFEDHSINQSSGDKIKSITKWFNCCLERDIRSYPEQYFWVHRRWKSAAPSGEPE